MKIKLNSIMSDFGLSRCIKWLSYSIIKVSEERLEKEAIKVFKNFDFKSEIERINKNTNQKKLF